MPPNNHREDFTMAPVITMTSESIPSHEVSKDDKAVPVTSLNRARPLHCAAQQYAWGRLGSSSSVALMKDAQAALEGDESFEIDEDKPYAELWLGTHPNGMCSVTVHKDANSTEGGDKQTLLDYVRNDPVLHCGRREWTDLSFLLKVLSVRKVLSIQAHPDKVLAEQLHADRPKVYKDPNHKPEMAIAMSDQVRAMCGFRPLSEISQHLDEYPEFRTVIGEDTANELQSLQNSPSVRHVLQHMFKEYMEAEPELIRENVEKMVERIRTMNHQNDLQKLMLQLEQQFPGDSGIFAPLIFNVVELRQGQGLFISANEPHAYISGEILECMACSDNVVRAGLTPKLKDVPTLVDMLTYNTRMPELHNGKKVDEFTLRYEPPIHDFCVEVITVPANQTYEIHHVHSPSVLLTLDGEATLKQDTSCNLEMSFGSAAFCSAGTKCTVVGGDYGIRMARAFTNVFHEKYRFEQ